MDQRDLKRLLDEYLKELYEYNEKLPPNVRLKVFHYVKAKGKVYVYIGKYFYKWEKDGAKLRWKYLGKEPPEGLPKPPTSPLEGTFFVIKNGKVYVRRDVYEKYLKRKLKLRAKP